MADVDYNLGMLMVCRQRIQESIWDVDRTKGVLKSHGQYKALMEALDLAMSLVGKAVADEASKMR